MRPAGIPSGNILDRFRLDGKIIVVTGAARGLGFTFATALAQAGAIIAGVDLLDEPTADFKTLTSFGGKAQYYRADVTNYEQLKQIIAEIVQDFGGISGCVTAAGIIRSKPFVEHTPDDVNATLAVNVAGLFYTIQLCTEQMIRQDQGGSIVAIASGASYGNMYPQVCSAYVASKWAVRGLVKQLAGELAEHKIRVNSISPGIMRTDMVAMLMRDHPEYEQLYGKLNMSGRIGEPDELSGALLYLMSDASSFTTAEDILVDAGQRETN